MSGSVSAGNHDGLFFFIILEIVMHQQSNLLIRDYAELRWHLLWEQNVCRFLKPQAYLDMTSKLRNQPFFEYVCTEPQIEMLLISIS